MINYKYIYDTGHCTHTYYDGFIYVHNDENLYTAYGTIINLFTYYFSKECNQ